MDTIYQGIVLGLIVGAFVLYLLPCIIAYRREHLQFYSITALNVLLGWTVLFWVASLVWSLSYQPEKKPVDYSREAWDKR